MSRTRSRPRFKPSKLALTLSLFYMHTLAFAADSPALSRRSWRPNNELPGANFILGDGKNEGKKVKGYEGEWPLWSSFRNSKVVVDDPLDPVAPAGNPQSSLSSSSTVNESGEADRTAYVCVPIGDCEQCPQQVIYLPYCRPYNNRRRVACTPVSSRDDPDAIQAALSTSIAAKTRIPKTTNTTTVTSSTALLGYEACGKSAKQEARDYFEMIAVVASIAIFSVWAFVQRQKLLFKRQNQQLLSRVTGQRRGSALPRSATVGGGTAGLRANRKKRAARLAPPISSSAGSYS
ncbi:uncharacterized protein MEPE_03884 [Melanopsichium pennsylvanicum]|uniref:Uncharacterized protein n=1 Tax=Melanopsichium pennsylvanicum TaxID=63383 RepID=A0AAJ4XM91_9BASI|nr:uncharacterized protein MEPE_03884 [Melanopsichium pennsylvanicum]